MKNNLKNYLTAGVIGVLMISATACGSQPSGSQDSPVTTAVTTEAESTTAEELAPQWGDEEEQVFWENYLDSVKETKTSLTLILRNIKENKKPSATGIAGSDSISSFRGGLKDMVTSFDRWLQEERR